MLLNDLEANRAKWSSSGIRNYQFDFTLACFCGFTDMPITIVVQDGEMQSMTYASGAPVPAGVDYDAFFRLSTIERNFKELEADILGDWSVDVTYDPDLGFPNKINTSGAPDAGSQVTIAAFKVLS
jgi:hypothetical protein